MEEEKKPKEIKDVDETIIKQIDEEIKKLAEKGVKADSIDYLYKLVDVKKDVKNLGKESEEKDMYRDYGEYGDNYGRRGVPGTGRGRYRRYRGEDALDEMKYHYGNYMDGGSYGAKEDSSDKMVECFEEWGYSIAQELEPKDKMKFKKAMQKIMQELN